MSKKNNTFTMVAIIALVGSVGWVGYTIYQRRKALTILKNKKIQYGNNWPLTEKDLLELYGLAQNAYDKTLNAWNEGGIFFGTNVPKPGTRPGGGGSDEDQDWNKP
jgi:hypothetical protein